MSVWCEPDGCPAEICGGPHKRVVSEFGDEIIFPVNKPPDLVAIPLPAPDTVTMIVRSHDSTRYATITVARGILEDEGTVANAMREFLEHCDRYMESLKSTSDKSGT